MARVTFTANLERHLSCPPMEAPGETVREVFDRVFAENEAVRGYILDDQAALRKHMAIFVDGFLIRDRVGLTDAVRNDSKIYVVQSLSGG